MGRRSANHLLQIWERKQGNETHGVGTYHSERGELILLIVIFSHHAKQRTVRHIDCGIASHHEKVKRVGVDSLTDGTKVGRIEQQGENHAQGHGSEDKPWPIGAPATLGAVSQRTHQRVGNHIKHTRYEHQRSRVSHCQSEDIGEE